MTTEDSGSQRILPYSAHDIGVLCGFLVTGIGFILLLDYFGISLVHDLWRYWPGALIVVGIARLREERSKVASGVHGTSLSGSRVCEYDY